MRRLRRLKYTDIFIGIIFSLLFISIGVIITINFRPLYYLDIKLLQIEKNSGFSKEEIIDNYNTLIDYSSPFYRGELEFPTFTASKAGLQHFKEVKDIFTLFYILAGITLIAAVIIILYKRKRKDINYLLTSSITAIVLPVLVGLGIGINFDAFFVFFHKIFFNNDYWIFDPVTDPVILILPDTFFLHCAILIISLVLLGSLSLYLIYHHKKKHSGIKNRKIRGLKL